MQQATKRIGYLDAVRGIAACMVMAYHFTGWKYPDKLSIKLSHLVFNGSDAVSLFFVLSGFVLSFPYLQHNKSLDVGKFYMNRIFRIYPAFIVAFIINTVFCIRNGLKGSPLDALWDTFGFRGIKFWEELILLRGRQNYLALDWTLTIEIVMSFFIPYLIAMTLQNKKLLLWFTFTTFLMGFIIGKFVMPFALGMLLSQYFYKIQAEEFKQTKWYRYRALFLTLAFILFSLRHLDKIVLFGERVNYWMEFTQLEFFSCSAIGSFIFLVYIIHSSKAQRVLEHPILIFIGKISYGIYLMHWVFVAATFEYWSLVLSFFPNVATAFIAMFMICCALTLLSATVLYYWVELPFIKKGKQITENWKPSVVIANKP